jgi:hypothetical protein
VAHSSHKHDWIDKKGPSWLGVEKDSFIKRVCPSPAFTPLQISLSAHFCEMHIEKVGKLFTSYLKRSSGSWHNVHECNTIFKDT